MDRRPKLVHASCSKSATWVVRPGRSWSGLRSRGERGLLKGRYSKVSILRGPLRMALRERTLRGSISAEAARRNDCLEFSQVEVADRLQRLGGGRLVL